MARAVLAGLGALAVVPAEFSLSAQSRAGGDGQRARLEIADDHRGLQQIDQRSFLDVAFELAGDRDLVGAYGAGQLGAGLDREIALDIDVALELSGDPDAAAALDLALDGDVRGNQRLL